MVVKIALIIIICLLSYSLQQTCDNPLNDPSNNYFSISQNKTTKSITKLSNETACYNILYNGSCCTNEELNNFETNQWVTIKQYISDYLLEYQGIMSKTVEIYKFISANYTQLMVEISNSIQSNYLYALKQREMDGVIVNLTYLFPIDQNQLNNNITRYNNVLNHYDAISTLCAEQLLKHWAAMACFSCNPNYTDILQFATSYDGSRSYYKLILSQETCWDLVDSQCYEWTIVMKTLREEIMRVIYIYQQFRDAPRTLDTAFEIGRIWYNKKLPYGNELYNINCTRIYCGDICSWLSPIGFTQDFLGHLNIIDLQRIPEFKTVISLYLVYEASNRDDSIYYVDDQTSYRRNLAVNYTYDSKFQYVFGFENVSYVTRYWTRNNTWNSFLMGNLTGFDLKLRPDPPKNGISLQLPLLLLILHLIAILNFQ